MTGILVTRPQPDGDAFAELLRAKGYTPFVDPLFTLQCSDVPPPQGSYQALAVTSRNALRALSQSDGIESFQRLPLFAVGTETETLARTLGFVNVFCAEQSAQSLAVLVKENMSVKSSLLYLAGDVRKSILEESLRGAGYDLEIWEGYHMLPSPALLPETYQAFETGKIDAVTLLSERASQHFLILTQSLPSALLTKPLYACLSEQVAAPLRLKNFNVRIAEKPVLAALVDTLPPKNH